MRIERSDNVVNGVKVTYLCDECTGANRAPATVNLILVGRWTVLCDAHLVELSLATEHACQEFLGSTVNGSTP